MSLRKLCFGLSLMVALGAGGSAQALTIADGAYAMKGGPAALQQLVNLQRDGKAVNLLLGHKKSNVLADVSDDGGTIHVTGKVIATGAGVKGKKAWLLDVVYQNVVDVVATAGNNSGTIKQLFRKRNTFDITDAGPGFTFKYVGGTSSAVAQSVVETNDVPPQQDNPGTPPVANPEPSTAVLGLLALAGISRSFKRRRAA